MCPPGVKPSQQMSLTSSSVLVTVPMATSPCSHTESKPSSFQSTVDCHMYVDVEINHKNRTLSRCAKQTTNKNAKPNLSSRTDLSFKQKEKRYRTETSAWSGRSNFKKPTIGAVLSPTAWTTSTEINNVTNTILQTINENRSIAARTMQKLPLK